MTLAARTRRFYWKRVRRYRYEICGRPNHLHGTIRRGCGRPVGVVWHASTGIWNYVVTGKPQTIYTVRAGGVGPARAPVEERAEGVGGVLCLTCFDRFARECGVHLQWESRPL